jgi:N-acetylmuramoyl-L-alanine amidase
MPIHRVAQGERASSIAQMYGFGDARTIYDHPDNEALRQKRPDPEVLLEGDRIFIPERAPKEQECAAGKVHRFTVKRPKSVVKVVIKERDGEPIADADYVLLVGDEEREGKTAGGLVEQPVPADATSALLLIPSLKLAMRLDLGHLDPHDEATGAQQRLRNLRHYAGKVDGDIGPKTQAALRAFQKANGLEETGALDDATRDALKAQHGC